MDCISCTMNMVVTGGTKGIGRALVECFAEAGFNVFTCARNKDELQSMQSVLRSQYPNQSFHVMACDLGNKQSVMEFASTVGAHFKQLDVLINNAGIFLPGSLTEEEDGVFETQMNVNLGSAYHITRAMMPLIKASKSAHIFNMCSTASIVAYTNGGSYCISKFAMLGFSRVLREELKKDQIRVTAVLPGPTLTDSWAGANLPTDRFMTAQDIADAVMDCYRLKSAVVEELLLRPMQGDISAN